MFFVGFIVLLEGGRTFEIQLAVNGVGCALLGSAAWLLTRRKVRLAVRAREPAGGSKPRHSDKAGTL